MSFEWPLGLLALALVPLAAAGYVVLHRRRSRAIPEFANPLLYPNLIDRRPGWRRHVPVALLLGALTLLLTGVARPQATISVRREEATIVLAIDVSRSMVATDVTPSRLAAAQAAARTFLAKVPPAYRVGLVAFAERADVAAAATRDREALNTVISSLRPGRGTALGDAIERALEVALRATKADPNAVRLPEKGERSPSAILLLSDGAQTQGSISPLDAARRARGKAVPVYTVALGTDQGVVERILPGGYRERIRVPPDPKTLRQVAETTGGSFFAAPDQNRLQRVYTELGSRLGKQEKKEEVTFALAAAGGVLAIVAALISELWFRRVPSP